MNNIDLIISNLKDKSKLTKPSIIPKMVFVGGIPGAGKNLLVEKTKNIFSNDEFNVIDVDLYRRYINHAKSVEDTIREANKIVMELFEFFIENKKNIIIVGTLRSFEHLDNLISNELIPKNYEIYFNIIVTNRIEATLSTYERYVKDKNNKDILPRLNRLDFLNDAYIEFHEAMRKYSKKSYFKNHKLFIRGENKELPSELEFIGDIDEAILNEEKRQITILDKNSIKNRIKSVYGNLSTDDEIHEFDLVCKEILNNF